MARLAPCDSACPATTRAMRTMTATATATGRRNDPGSGQRPTTYIPLSLFFSLSVASSRRVFCIQFIPCPANVTHTHTPQKKRKKKKKRREKEKSTEERKSAATTTTCAIESKIYIDRSPLPVSLKHTHAHTSLVLPFTVSTGSQVCVARLARLLAALGLRLGAQVLHKDQRGQLGAERR